MKALLVLLLSCTSLFAGERLVAISSGETNFISYGLFCLVSDSRSASNAPAGENLVLVLRNDGSKWDDLTAVTSKNFDLRDAKGHQMKVYLLSSPRGGMPYGGAETIQLLVTGNGDARAPWTLRFSAPEPFLPKDLTITDIKPRKK